MRFSRTGLGVAFGMAAIALAAALGAAAPAVVETTPQANAVAVDVWSLERIEVKFDRPMSVPTTSSFQIRGSILGPRDAIYSKRREWGSADHRRVNTVDEILVAYKLSPPFMAGEEVEVTLTTGIESAAGDPLAAPYTLRFTCGASQRLGFDAARVPFRRIGNANPGENLNLARTGDLNGDGAPDLILAQCANPLDPDGNYVGHYAVLLNNGTGHLPVASTFGQNHEMFPYEMAIADFNGDDRLDVVGAGYTSSIDPADPLSVKAYLYINDGAASYSGAAIALYYDPNAESITGAGRLYQSVNALAAGDLDGDSHIDLIIAPGFSEAPQRGKSLVVCLNRDGNGSFPDADRSTLSTVFEGTQKRRVDDVALGDIDNDGDLDAFCGAKGPNIMYRNDGSGTFPLADRREILADAEGQYLTQKVALGDLDNDGWTDVVFSQGNPADVTGSWLFGTCRNDGAGEFSSANRSWIGEHMTVGGGFSAAQLISCGDIALADLDDDSFLDIVVGKQQDGPLLPHPIITPSLPDPNLIFHNDGNGRFPVDGMRHLGNFAGNVQFGVGVSFPTVEEAFNEAAPSSISVADFDLDGDLDIAAANVGICGIHFAGEAIATQNLPAATAGQPWRYQLRLTSALSGPAPTVTWSLLSVPGKGLPSWLALDAATGELAGTPPTNAPADFIIEVRLTGSIETSARSRYVLNILPAALPLDYTEDFEAIACFATGASLFGRAVIRAEAASSGTQGLLFDAQPSVTNWSLQTPGGGPGRAAADDPSAWEMAAPEHIGMAEWSIEAGTNTDLAVSFDVRIESDSSQAWYTNLVCEYSDDGGATWNNAYDAACAAVDVVNGVGIYRKPTVGFVSSRFEMSGIQPARGILLLRMRSLVKYSFDNAAPIFHAGISVDKLRVESRTPLRVVLPATLDGAEFAPYSAVFGAAGGGSDYSWAMDGGSLPPGLAFTASLPVAAPGLTLAGIPAAEGSYVFRLRVMSASGHSVTPQIAITIADVPELEILTQALPDGVAGQPYESALRATGGSMTDYEWALRSGALPEGISGISATPALATPGMLLTGTPAVAGLYTLDIVVTDSTGMTATRTLTLAVQPAPPAPEPVWPSGGGGCAVRFGGADDGWVHLISLALLLLLFAGTRPGCAEIVTAFFWQRST